MNEHNILKKLKTHPVYFLHVQKVFVFLETNWSAQNYFLWLHGEALICVVKDDFNMTLDSSFCAFLQICECVCEGGGDEPEMEEKWKKEDRG